MVIARVNGEDNEWLVKAKNAQNVIEDSVAKLKSSGTSEDKIKLVADNAFQDFVKFVKNGANPILKKPSITSNKNSQIKTKLSNWIDVVEHLNNASNNSSHRTAQNSLDYFKITIKTIIENAPQFAGNDNSASPEYRETLLEVGRFMNEVVEKLTNNMKDVESKLQNTKKTVQENEWLIKATNAQRSIEDSIAKIKSYGASEERIKSATDSAFDNFVEFVNNKLTPIHEKLNKNPGSNPRVQTKLNNWIQELKRLSASKSTAQESLNKFESTVKTMVKNASTFADKINSASAEYRETLLEVGRIMKDIIDKLANSMKDAESQLRNPGKIVKNKK